MSDNIPDNIPNDLLIRPHKKGAFVKGDPADFLIDSPAEQIEPAEPSTSWAEIVCEDGANMRTLPAGSLKSWLPKGVRVHLTGNSSVANNLTWFEIVGGYWVARADSEGTVLIEDIYE